MGDAPTIRTETARLRSGPRMLVVVGAVLALASAGGWILRGCDGPPTTTGLGFAALLGLGLSATWWLVLHPLSQEVEAEVRDLEARGRELAREVEERSRAEQRFRCVLEASPTAMLTVERGGRITLANSKASELFGYPPGELLGLSIERLVPEGVREGHKRLREAFHDAPEARGMGVGRDLFALRKDGREVPVEIGLAPIGMPDGPLVLATVLDIRERVAHEADLARHRTTLERKNRELERSNRDLDDFAYIASHDLREPLRGIRTYASILLEDQAERLDEEGRDQLEKVMRLCARLDSLIESLLRYARVGRTPLALASTDLNEVLEDVLDSLGVSIQEKGLDVRVERALPTLRCDPVRVAEVFRNLLTNAMKYTDRPDPQVEVGWSEGEAGPSLWVRDNGIGIPPQHLETIFGIFKRLHARERYGGGTGAGLTIVKKIVEQHGGSIAVASTPGEGSTFTFTLARRDG